MQSRLEKAVSATTQEPVQVVGSGRTDAGAHAVCQVVAFSTGSDLPADTLCRAINAYLPDDIAVTRALEVDAAFDPRADARSRIYRYVIWNRPIGSPFMAARTAHVRTHLDADVMQAAANCLIGTHDMSSFIPVQAESSRERTIYSARCWRSGELVAIELEASGFMRQMVRAIAGTLIRVGAGKLTPGQFATILRSRDRTLAGDTAPAGGLYLVDVRYEGLDIGSDYVSSSGLPWIQDGVSAVLKEKA